MTRFTRQNGIFVPSSSEDSLEKQVSSTHRKSRIVDSYGRSFYFDRDGKAISEDVVRAKSAELKTYKEGLGIKLEGGTVLDFLINNKTVEYVSDSGRKETADLKDAALKKRFVETIAAVKDALKGNADYYDSKTDTLKLSSEDLVGILGVVDEYAVDHYTADINVRRSASLRIAQKITARPASVDDKVVQLPVYDGSTGSNGAGWAAAAAAGLILALAGCSLTYDPYARPRRKQKNRSGYKKTEWGNYEQPLRAGIGFVHNGNTSDVTSATGDQTWNTPSNGLELYVDGSAAQWSDFDYRKSRYHRIIIPVVFDYRCLWLSNSGSIEGDSGSLGNIEGGSEQWFRLMSGIAYQLERSNKYNVLFRGLIGVETMKDDVSFTYDVNDIDVLLNAGGFAWYFGIDGRLNNNLVLGIGYGQSGMNGNQTTDVSSGGIPLSSENLDVNGTRRRFDFRAVINPFDLYEVDEWYGPTEIIYSHIHDDLSVFDRASNELGVKQHFNLSPKVALYLGVTCDWGTKDSTDANEDISGYRIMLGADLTGLINGRSK